MIHSSVQSVMVPVSPGRRPKIAGVILFSVLSVILVASFSVPFHLNDLMPGCLFRAVTDVPCPGCGMTRSFLLIGHGHFSEAFLMNPSAPFAFIIVVLLWLRSFVYMMTGREISGVSNEGTRLLVVISAAFMAISAWIYNIFFNPYI